MPVCFGLIIRVSGIRAACVRARISNAERRLFLEDDRPRTRARVAAAARDEWEIDAFDILFADGWRTMRVRVLVCVCDVTQRANGHAKSSLVFGGK